MTTTEPLEIDDLADVTVSAPEPAPPAEERPRDARWGFLADGITPRRRPGRPRKGETAAKATKTRNAGRRASSAGSGRQSAPQPPKPPRQPAAKDYTEALSFWFGAIVGPLGMVFPLDAMAISLKAPKILKLGNQMGNDLPWLGAWLDKANKYTPYAAALSLGAELGVQFAHNHGFVSEQMAVAFGAIPRTHLAEMMAAQRAQAAAEKADEQRRFDEAMAAAQQQRYTEFVDSRVGAA